MHTVPVWMAGHLLDVERAGWFWRSAVIGEGGTPASALYPSSPKTSQVQTPADSQPANSLQLLQLITASITAAPARRMSYYLDPVSSCQALQLPDCLGVMRSSGGMAVTVVPHMQLPAVCHPQTPAPPRPQYGQHITLQEVPNGAELSPSEKASTCTICTCMCVLGWIQQWHQLSLDTSPNGTQGHKGTRARGLRSGRPFPKPQGPWGIGLGRV
ncbi:uncharacterized protein LOC107709549 [Sinocyclocheilus rhinocerous]|uniref:uncharacterized protein LOC107709549 n=1 Tax=Sinocyclocheilus rhinocerous TaxID=307959 RepID=UPI0007BAC7FC|nr:PREDICTED: uncharacterized protein LOC107709549 [Sinocyclocheilus rhinocerous]